MNSMNSFHPTLVKLETTRAEHGRSARRAARYPATQKPAETTVTHKRAGILDRLLAGAATLSAGGR